MEQTEQTAFIEGNTQYEAFVQKFEPKKTTDDCYTPQEVYDVIADWVAEQYPQYDRAKYLRPFKPGGDYQAEEYPAGCAVVDNPPFSILSQVVDWYIVKGVPFFLFGPSLTSLGLLKSKPRKPHICIILVGAEIIYENGASVATSFVTNMDKYAVRIEADLRNRIEDKVEELRKQEITELPKYIYPSCVLTGAAYRLAKYGQTLRIRHSDCVAIGAMDSQKKYKKTVFGGGLLLSERAAAERAAAELAKAYTWEVSDREQAIIDQMGRGENIGTTLSQDEQLPGQIGMDELLRSADENGL